MCADNYEETSWLLVDFRWLEYIGSFADINMSILIVCIKYLYILDATTAAGEHHQIL